MAEDYLDVYQAQLASRLTDATMVTGAA